MGTERVARGEEDEGGILITPPAFVWGADRKTCGKLRMSFSVDHVGVKAGNTCFTLDVSYRCFREVGAVVLAAVEKPYGFRSIVDAFFVRVEIVRAMATGDAREAVVFAPLLTVYDVEYHGRAGENRFLTDYGCHGDLPEYPSEITLVELVHVNDEHKRGAIRVRHDVNVCTDTKMLLHFMVEQELLVETHRRLK